MTTYNDMAAEIVSDPACSFWLQDAVLALHGRDCCGALNDVNTLAVLCDLRVDEIMGPVPMCDQATATMFEAAETQHKT